MQNRPTTGGFIAHLGWLQATFTVDDDLNCDVKYTSTSTGPSLETNTMTREVE